MYGQIPINKVDRDEQSFWKQRKFGIPVQIYDPIDDDSSHIFVNFCLATHKRPVSHGSVLRPLHMFLNFTAIFADVVHVRKRGLINSAHPRMQSVDALVIHGFFGWKTNLGQLFTRSKITCLPLK